MIAGTRRAPSRDTSSQPTSIIVAVATVAGLAAVTAGLGSDGMLLVPVIGIGLAVPYMLMCVSRPVLAWAVALALTMLAELQVGQGSQAAFGLGDFAFAALVLARVVSRPRNSAASTAGAESRGLGRAFYCLTGLYAVIAAFSSVTAPDGAQALKEAAKWLEIGLIAWVSVDTLADEAKLHLGLLACWCTWGFQSLGIVLARGATWLTGNVSYARGGGEVGSLLVVISVAVLLTDGSRHYRNFARLGVIIGLFSIGVSLERQSLITVSAAVIAMLALAAQRGTQGRHSLAVYRLRVAGFILTCVGITAALLPSTTRDYFIARIVTPDTASNLARAALVNASLDMFAKHQLLGVGAGNFSIAVQSYPLPGEPVEALATIGPHNWFLTFAAETGVIGLTVFLAVVVLLSYAAIRAVTGVRARTLRWYQVAILGMWTHWLVTFAFADVTGFTRVRWAATVGVIVAVHGLADRDRRLGARGATPAGLQPWAARRNPPPTRPQTERG